MEGKNLTPRVPSSKHETGMLGFAPGQVTWGWGCMEHPVPVERVARPAWASAQSKEQDPSGVLGCGECRLE